MNSTTRPTTQATARIRNSNACHSTEATAPARFAPSSGPRRWLLLSLLPLAVLSSGATSACGGKDQEAVKVPEADVAMNDALALLPGNAIAVGTVDGRAFFGSQTFGSELAKLVEKYMPIGQEAGFQASRDVDRVTFASYSYQGIDAAAVIIGRFDEAKIKQVAASHTPTKGGGTLVQSQYAGRDVFTMNNVGFTLLSDKMAIGGTEAGIRRVLERIQDKRVKRDITPWMIQTVESPGAAAAVAGDFVSNPLPAEAMRQIPMPFMQNLKAVRVVASFKDQGVQVAGSMTYPDAAAADTASQSVKQAVGLTKWLAVFGIKVQNVDVKVDKTDVQTQFSVDDQSLRQLLATVPQWLGQ